jgi:hypothetical protein
MQRRPDWQSQLTRYLAQIARKPFTEGAHDCFLFCADAGLAITGVDLADGWRGHYATTRAGLKLFRRAGYGDHIGYVAQHLPETPTARARAGDWVVVATDDGPSLGILQGEMIYVLMQAGLGLVPRSAALRAFKVG